MSSNTSGNGSRLLEVLHQPPRRELQVDSPSVVPSIEAQGRAAGTRYRVAFYRLLLRNSQPTVVGELVARDLDRVVLEDRRPPGARSAPYTSVWASAPPRVGSAQSARPPCASTIRRDLQRRAGTCRSPPDPSTVIEVRDSARAHAVPDACAISSSSRSRPTSGVADVGRLGRRDERASPTSHAAHRVALALRVDRRGAPRSANAWRVSRWVSASTTTAGRAAPRTAAGPRCSRRRRWRARHAGAASIATIASPLQTAARTSQVEPGVAFVQHLDPLERC